MLSRRLIFRVVAGTVLAMCAAALAVAIPGRQLPGRSSNEEVSSYAVSAGISQDAARGKLRDQSQLAELMAAGSTRLGSSYGGVWVESPGDERIKLAVARQGFERETSSQAVQAIRDVHLQGRVDVVGVPRGIDALEALRLDLDAQLARVNRGAPVTIDAVPSPRNGTVDLLRPPRGVGLTRAQEAFLREASSRYGPSLRLRFNTGSYDDQSR